MLQLGGREFYKPLRLDAYVDATGIRVRLDHHEWGTIVDLPVDEAIELVAQAWRKLNERDASRSAST